jgi:hypothetical protein
MDTPGIIHGGQVDYKKLYYSDPMAALKIPVSISPGFGVLKQGTILARNTSAAATGYSGYCIPYQPLAVTGAEYAPGRAFLLVDDAADYTRYVSNDDSYKFKAGDTLYAIDSDNSVENLGELTSITRNETTGRAALLHVLIGTAGVTTAKYGHIYTCGGIIAVGILEKSVDTGVGANAKGALATMIISNAVLYAGMVLNYDETANDTLLGSTIGQYLVLK